MSTFSAIAKIAAVGAIAYLGKKLYDDYQEANEFRKFVADLDAEIDPDDVFVTEGDEERLTAQDASAVENEDEIYEKIAQHMGRIIKKTAPEILENTDRIYTRPSPKGAV
jgi:hypothetical protein